MMLAHKNLGLLYAQGLGVPRDLKRAVHYLELAARANVRGAQEELDRIRRQRLGPKRILLQAGGCVLTAPPWMRRTSPSFSIASRSRRTVSEDTPNRVTSSCTLTKPVLRSSSLILSRLTCCIVYDRLLTVFQSRTSATLVFFSHHYNGIRLKMHLHFFFL